MATASSNNDNDLFPTPGSSDDEDDDDSAAGQLQKFFENDKNVKPADKIPYIINLCFAYLDDFSTQAAPYNHQLFKNSKKNHKISNPLLKVEIKRRDSSAKLSNKKQNDLLELLKSNPLPAKDIEYLKRQESSYKAKCQQAIDEHAQSSTAAAAPAPSDRGPNITLDDKFRLIEAFFSDKAKERLAATQLCLSREEIDARNSVLAVEDYFETTAKVFNDPNWVPTLKAYPHLHPELAHSRELPLKDYRATRSKVKDKYGEFKNQLHGMVINYEKSGNGGMQRSNQSNDWGTFDFEELMDGDDRSSFLPNNNQDLFYLLYYWQRLDEEGQVQFTLAKLPEWMKANSGQFALTSQPGQRSSAAANEKAFTQLSASIGTVGESIATYAVASIGRNVDKFEKDLFALEMKMVDVDDADPRYNIFKKRKEALEKSIQKAKSDEAEARKRLKKD